MEKYKKTKNLIFIILIFFVVFSFSACNRTNKGENQTSKTKISIKNSVTKNISGIGDVFLVKVPNEQIVFKFFEYISIQNNADWIVSTDIYGNNIIRTKTVELELGDSPLYYISLTDKDNKNQTYFVIIHRNLLFDVFFNTNGGTSCESQVIEEDNYLTDIPTSSRIGYTFVGWDYDFEKSPITKSIIVNAIWKENEYKITYEANGGNISSSTQIVGYGKYVNLAIPSRNGYTFLGWYDDNNTKYTDGTWNKMSNVVLTAKWQINTYSITYNLNGGAISKKITSYDVKTETFVIPNPTKIGYIFKGYKINDNESLVVDYKVEKGTIGNITLTAKWQINTYSITYKLNGGVINSNKKILYDVETETFVISNPTKTGYTFKGYKVNDNESLVFDYKVKKGTTGNITLTATWEVNTYKVTLDVNGGNALTNTKLDIVFDSKFKIETPTRTGYTFLGWFNGDSKITGSTWNIASDVTLTAKWQIDTYSITYNLNGGSNNAQNLTTFTIKNLPIKLYDPFVTNTEFYGWIINGSNDKITEITTLKNYVINANWGLTYTLSSNKRFYSVSGKYCKLKNIEIKGEYNNTPVKAISLNGFENLKNLQSILIPDSITNIGSGAFFGCNNLQEITLPFVGGSETENTFLGYIFGASKYSDNSNVVPTSLRKVTITKDIGRYAFYYCVSLTNVTIGNSVKCIRDYAFSHCVSLTEVTIPNSVKSIGNRVFSSCSSLTGITIPSSVTSIGSYVFDSCSGLTSIKIPNSVTSIGSYVFNGCSSLTSVTMGNSVTSIGNYTFYDCGSLTSIKIPNSVTSIGSSAFYDCHSLTSVTIGNSVTSIGSSAFYCCSNLTSVTIGNNVKSIGDYAFFYCLNLTEVTIPNSVTSIGYYAFDGCSNLTSVAIGNSVTGIGEYSFYNCHSLTNITISNNVKSVGIYAFNGCRSLSKVYYKGGASEWNMISIRFYNDYLEKATRYYYSATKPSGSGNYWHYDTDGNIKEW